MKTSTLEDKKEIWIAETQNDGLIWGDTYDEMANTTLFFFSGSVEKVNISLTTYNKLLETDGDNCACYYPAKRFGKIIAIGI